MPLNFRNVSTGQRIQAPLQSSIEKSNESLLEHLNRMVVPMVESLVDIVEGGDLLFQLIQPGILFFVFFYRRLLLRTQLNVSTRIVDPG